MPEMSSINTQSSLANVQQVDPSKAVSNNARQPGQQGEGKSFKELKVPEVEYLSSGDMDKLKENLNEALEPINIKLNFTEDRESGQWVVKVLNRENSEVIRQIPPEALLKMAKRMEELNGLFVDLWS